MKTHLIGYTKSGAIVARASASDKGYTHAAVGQPEKFAAGAIIPTSCASFSTSADGARRNVGRYYPNPEIVAVSKVDGAEYRRITGKS